jgi:hypothetical protein
MIGLKRAVKMSNMFDPEKLQALINAANALADAIEADLLHKPSETTTQVVLKLSEYRMAYINLDNDLEKTLENIVKDLYALENDDTIKVKH